MDVYCLCYDLYCHYRDRTWPVLKGSRVFFIIVTYITFYISLSVAGRSWIYSYRCIGPIQWNASFSC